MNQPLAVIFTLIPAVGLWSCAATQRIGNETRSFVGATSTKVSRLSEMTVERVRPAGVRIVEVREQDLKELPTGHERALAFERSRKSNFWIFNGPVDFNEPMLPEMGAELDGSLLPPRQP